MRLRHILTSIAIMLALLSVSGAALAFPMEFVAEEGVAIKEINSGDNLYSQNGDEQYYPASTTKLMTALVTTEVIGDRIDDKVTIGEEISLLGYDSSTAHLEVGEVYTYRQLLYALLLPSGNDAANVLAANVGREIDGNKKLSYGKAMDVFIDAMNDRAIELGCLKTQFKNAHGLHDPNHYTTPDDLLLIAEAAAGDPMIKQVENTKIYEMTTSRGELQRWKNTNLLLYKNAADYGAQIEEGRDDNPFYNAYAIGGKTGNTDEGGRCFTFTAVDGDEEIVGVILKSEKTKIFEESNQAINVTFENYTLHYWSDASSVVGDYHLTNNHYNDSDTLTAKTDAPFASMIAKDEGDDYEKKIIWDTAVVEEKEDDKGLKLLADITQGQKIGSLEVYKDGEFQKSADILAGATIHKRGLLDFIRFFIIFILPVLIILVIILRVIGYNRRKAARLAKQKAAAARYYQKYGVYPNQRGGSRKQPPRQNAGRAQPPTNRKRRKLTPEEVEARRRAQEGRPRRRNDLTQEQMHGERRTQQRKRKKPQ